MTLLQATPTWADEDPYAVLGVSRTAAPAEIEKAYRKLSMKYHPDRNPGDKAAEARLKDINTAYDRLDRPKKDGRTKPKPEPQARQSNFDEEMADRFREAEISKKFTPEMRMEMATRPIEKKGLGLSYADALQWLKRMQATRTDDEIDYFFSKYLIAIGFTTSKSHGPELEGERAKEEALKLVEKYEKIMPLDKYLRAERIRYGAYIELYYGARYFASQPVHRLGLGLSDADATAFANRVRSLHGLTADSTFEESLAANRKFDEMKLKYQDIVRETYFSTNNEQKSRAIAMEAVNRKQAELGEFSYFLNVPDSMPWRDQGAGAKAKVSEDDWKERFKRAQKFAERPVSEGGLGLNHKKATSWSAKAVSNTKTFADLDQYIEQRRPGRFKCFLDQFTSKFKD